MVKISGKFGSMILWAVVLSVLCFSGCGRRDTASTTELPGTAATTEPTMPTTLETVPTEPEATVKAAPELTREYDRDQVVLVLRPTGQSFAGDDLYYCTPADQETWVEAWNCAMAKADPDQMDDKRSSRGFSLRYQDDRLEVLADGSMFDSWYGRIAAEDCAELYALALDTYGELGLKDPVRPGQITGIRSATLELNGTHTITDPEKLEKLETWLANSRELSGGAACWFTALLTLELESGEEFTISMATDSCAAWMSEGVFYEYPSPDNLAFYSLFEVEDLFA